MSGKRVWQFAPFLGWPVVAAVTLASRAPLAVDETRYLTVAWEMFRDAQWLLPTLNGEAYTAKPPLFFWLIAGGWHAFGVSEWWPRLLPLVAALAAWAVLWRLAKRLWPQVEGVAPAAVVLAAGLVAWVALATTILFDMLLTLWILLAALGLVMAAGGARRGWGLFAVGLGLGVLTKGPVALLHLLPVGLLAPAWSAAVRAAPAAWYGRLAAALALGLAIPLAWAVPATLVGGEPYAPARLWTESAGRIVDSFAHSRAWWFYLAVLPAVVLPWTLWRPAWRAARSAMIAGEAGSRFALAWTVPTVVLLSAISGKQAHYLLPSLPGLALLAARGLATDYAMSYSSDRAMAAIPLLILGGVLAVAPWLGTDWHRGWLEDLHPAWGVAVLLVTAWAIGPFRVKLLEGAARLQLATALSLVLAAAGLLNSAAGRAYAVGAASREVAERQLRGAEVGYYGAYHGQLGFAGRLERPLKVLADGTEVAAFARQQTGAFVLVESAGNPLSTAPHLPVAALAYRSGFWSLWPADVLAVNPRILGRIGAVAAAGAGAGAE